MFVLPPIAAGSLYCASRRFMHSPSGLRSSWFGFLIGLCGEGRLFARPSKLAECRAYARSALNPSFR